MSSADNGAVGWSKAEERLMKIVCKHMRGVPDADWEAVATEYGYKSAALARSKYTTATAKFRKESTTAASTSQSRGTPKTPKTPKTPSSGKAGTKRDNQDFDESPSKRARAAKGKKALSSLDDDGDDEADFKDFKDIKKEEAKDSGDDEAPTDPSTEWAA